MSDDPVVEFWYELDDHFLFNVGDHPEVLDAYGAIEMPDGITNLRAEHRANGTYPAGFLADVTPMRDALELLSTEQLKIFDRHLAGDAETTQRAFEDFGQGVHFDERRDPGTRIHMMDASGPTNPAVGYHRWHAIIRAQIELGIDAGRWTQIDRWLGLGWAMQSEAQPVQGERANPGLPAARIDELRQRWLQRTPGQIDDAFDSVPYPSDAIVPTP
jgi:hypothetical protein